MCSKYSYRLTISQYWMPLVVSAAVTMAHHQSTLKTKFTVHRSSERASMIGNATLLENFCGS